MATANPFTSTNGSSTTVFNPRGKNNGVVEYLSASPSVQAFKSSISMSSRGPTKASSGPVKKGTSPSQGSPNYRVNVTGKSPVTVTGTPPGALVAQTQIAYTNTWSFDVRMNELSTETERLQVIADMKAALESADFLALTRDLANISA